MTAVDVPTGVVLTVNVTLVAPPGTVMLAGTAAMPGLLLASVTSAPPVGAGPLSVAVPVEEVPPVTLAGNKVRDASLTLGWRRLISTEMLAA